MIGIVVIGMRSLGELCIFCVCLARLWVDRWCVLIIDHLVCRFCDFLLRHATANNSGDEKPIVTRPADHVRGFSRSQGSRGGSGQEVLKYHGTGRVGSGQEISNIAGRDGLPRLDMTHEKP